ncbi:hypothetical protein [Chryseobacterium jejuense]|uniref:hypothetical protein n=1 Tax=Chryseobacterium jejuense TaxID=445960 RepID=UPI001AE58D28|nr:hypothetical protein [Chryseobacterium jejuense]MBP2616462.1 hypothetical protein [Chryseobacterium jejuense]
MGTINIIPIIITILQLAGISHVWYTYLYEDGQIPKSFIELNILAVFSICVWVFFRWKYFKPGKKTGLWLLPISISFLIILVLTIFYILMGIDKYK